MPNLNNYSFIAKGAKTEQRFANIVDKYLAGQDFFDKSLDDGTQFSIRKQELGGRGTSRHIVIFDDIIGYARTVPRRSLIGLN